MKKHWKITGWDGTSKILDTRMPGSMEPSEVTRALQRLVCRHLTDREVIAASLRKNYKGYAPFIAPIGSGPSIHVGSNPYYTASLLVD